MLFPSEVFLFVFLPVVLAVYYLFLRKTKRLKNIFLLIAALFASVTHKEEANDFARSDSSAFRIL